MNSNINLSSFSNTGLSITSNHLSFESKDNDEPNPPCGWDALEREFSIENPHWYDIRATIEKLRSVFSVLSVISTATTVHAAVKFSVKPTGVINTLVAAIASVTLTLLGITLALFFKRTFEKDPAYFNEQGREIWDQLRQLAPGTLSFSDLHNAFPDFIRAHLTTNDFNEFLRYDAYKLTPDDFLKKHGEEGIETLNTDNRKKLVQSTINKMAGLDALANCNWKGWKLNPAEFIHYVLNDEVDRLANGEISFDTFRTRNKKYISVIGSVQNPDVIKQALLKTLADTKDSLSTLKQSYAAELDHFKLTDSLASSLWQQQKESLSSLRDFFVYSELEYIKEVIKLDPDSKNNLKNHFLAFPIQTGPDFISALEITKEEYIEAISSYACRVSLTNFKQRFELRILKKEFGFSDENRKKINQHFIDEFAQKSPENILEEEWKGLDITMTQVLKKRWAAHDIYSIISKMSPKDKSLFYDNLNIADFDWPAKVDKEIEGKNLYTILTSYPTELFTHNAGDNNCRIFKDSKNLQIAINKYYLDNPQDAYTNGQLNIMVSSMQTRLIGPKAEVCEKISQAMQKYSQAKTLYETNTQQFTQLKDKEIKAASDKKEQMKTYWNGRVKQIENDEKTISIQKSRLQDYEGTFLLVSKMDRLAVIEKSLEELKGQIEQQHTTSFFTHEAIAQMKKMEHQVTKLEDEQNKIKKDIKGAHYKNLRGNAIRWRNNRKTYDTVFQKLKKQMIESNDRLAQLREQYVTEQSEFLPKLESIQNEFPALVDSFTKDWQNKTAEAKHKFAETVEEIKTDLIQFFTAQLA